MEFLLVGVNHNNVELCSSVEADNVIFVPEIFLPTIFDPRPYQISKGSRFSAKSWTKALSFLLRARNKEYFRCVFARNSQKAARESQFQLFKDLMSRYRLLGNEFKVREQQMRITHIETGHYIQGGSFEDPDGLMSVPEITDFWAEEPISREGSIDKESFQTIAGTLRNSYGIPSRFHMTFNPIGKNNFIYKDWFQEETMVYDESNSCILTANYDDNPFCPKDRIEFLDLMSKDDPQRYLVDGLGNWGEPKNDRPFLSKFRKSIHTTNHIFEIEQSETYLIFDFNHSPTVASMYQKVIGYGFVAVAEWSENGGTRNLCEIIKEDERFKQVDKLLITVSGDSSANSYTSTGGDSTDYDIILEVLEISKSQLEGVYSRNKALIYSRRLCNEFLHNVPFVISGACPKLANDLEIAREDDVGGLFKNRKNGYGMDLCDTFRYFVDLVCKNGMKDINYYKNFFQ